MLSKIIASMLVAVFAFTALTAFAASPQEKFQAGVEKAQTVKQVAYDKAAAKYAVAQNKYTNSITKAVNIEDPRKRSKAIRAALKKFTNAARAYKAALRKADDRYNTTFRKLQAKYIKALRASIAF